MPYLLLPISWFSIFISSAHQSLISHPPSWNHILRLCRIAYLESFIFYPFFISHVLSLIPRLYLIFYLWSSVFQVSSVIIFYLLRLVSHLLFLIFHLPLSSPCLLLFIFHSLTAIHNLLPRMLTLSLTFYRSSTILHLLSQSSSGFHLSFITLFSTSVS
jgi:hypothetical protein